MSLDDASNKKLVYCHTALAVAIRRVAEDMKNIRKAPMRVTDTLRDMARQEELYAKGRTQPGEIVTWARPGYSWHHYGLAADLCFVGADPYLEKRPEQERDYLWNEFGRFSKEHGLEWGGDFRGKPDKPHVQKRFGLTIDEAVEFYRVGGILAVWSQVDKILKA